MDFVHQVTLSNRISAITTDWSFFSISQYLSECLFVNQPVRSSFRPTSVCLSDRPSLPSIRSSVRSLVRLSFFPSVRPSFRPSIRLAFRPSGRYPVRSFVRPSNCLSVRPSVRPSHLPSLPIPPLICPSFRSSNRSLAVNNLYL